MVSSRVVWLNYIKHWPIYQLLSFVDFKEKVPTVNYLLSACISSCFHQSLCTKSRTLFFSVQPQPPEVKTSKLQPITKTVSSIWFSSKGRMSEIQQINRFISLRKEDYLWCKALTEWWNNAEKNLYFTRKCSADAPNPALKLFHGELRKKFDFRFDHFSFQCETRIETSHEELSHCGYFAVRRNNSLLKLQT